MLERRNYDCEISVIPIPTLLPTTTVFFSKDPIPQYNVWYDHFAIFSTRGFSNIYHNAEWIMNFIHYSNSIQELPLVFFSIIHSF